MKPIFTIHAGEYLVASELEKNFNVWLPAKDVGIDLLASDRENKKFVSIQVKFSKDFNTTTIKESLRANFKARGWWTLKRDKIAKSTADLWVFVLYSLDSKTCDYIILTPVDLLKIYDSLGRKANSIQSYITVTIHGRAFETRDLSREDNRIMGENKYDDPTRELTKYLNNWTALTKKLL